MKGPNKLECFQPSLMFSSKVRAALIFMTEKHGNRFAKAINTRLSCNLFKIAKS